MCCDRVLVRIYNPVVPFSKLSGEVKCPVNVDVGESSHILLNVEELVITGDGFISSVGIEWFGVGIVVDPS